YGTALRAAALFSNERAVYLLIERGANVNSLGWLYGSTLLVATLNALRGYKKVVRLLIKRDLRANINTQGGYYGTSLLAAINKGSLRTARLLIDSGADINVRGRVWGDTALQVVAYRGKEKFVPLLLDQGADINAYSGQYGTTLQAAAYNRHSLVMQLLVDRGANVNA
ncbi:vegetative incompatibility protein het-e-1, partial [Cenococcum geophilum]